MFSIQALERQRESFDRLNPVENRKVLMFALANALGQTVSERIPRFLTDKVYSVFTQLKEMNKPRQQFKDLDKIDLQLRRLEGALRWVTDDSRIGICMGVVKKTT